ncbi:MAG: CinA family protein [Pseudoclavibacter sp.]|nr:CinA family protein [Pseudoclavibacter sp.]
MIQPPLDRTRELVETLAGSQLTIAVAESLTGGALVAELVKVPGVSAVLLGGVVAYRTELKRSLLGVDAKHLARHGAVDPDTAVMMAAGVRRACRLEGQEPDLGIATTGVAGPDPQEGRPAGTVYIGIDGLWGSKPVELDFSSLVLPDEPERSRARIRQATVEAAVFNLIEYLAER